MVLTCEYSVLLFNCFQCCDSAAPTIPSTDNGNSSSIIGNDSIETIQYETESAPSKVAFTWQQNELQVENSQTEDVNTLDLTNFISI